MCHLTKKERWHSPEQKCTFHSSAVLRAKGKSDLQCLQFLNSTWLFCSTPVCSATWMFSAGFSSGRGSTGLCSLLWFSSTLCKQLLYATDLASLSEEDEYSSPWLHVLLVLTARDLANLEADATPCVKESLLSIPIGSIVRVVSFVWLEKSEKKFSRQNVIQQNVSDQVVSAVLVPVLSGWKMSFELWVWGSVIRVGFEGGKASCAMMQSLPLRTAQADTVATFAAQLKLETQSFQLERTLECLRKSTVGIGTVQATSTKVRYCI